MTIEDIYAEARDLVDANSTSYPDADMLRRLNSSYEDVISKILRADGLWQFDDRNFTTNPRGTMDLEEGVESYSFSDQFLDIEEVDILDLDGIYRRIKPFDPSELGGLSTEEYFGKDNTGFPQWYDKLGNTIRLRPIPTAEAITLTAGMRVTFSRTADFYTQAQVDTGTKEPGFALNHIILSYKIALPYAIKFKKDRVNDFNDEIERLQDLIIEHYSFREKDRRKQPTMKPINFR